jgi:hypothetical protein
MLTAERRECWRFLSCPFPFWHYLLQMFASGNVCSVDSLHEMSVDENNRIESD